MSSKELTEPETKDKEVERSRGETQIISPKENPSVVIWW